MWDRDGRLRELELKGDCTLRAWEDLLAALGCPSQDVMIVWFSTAFSSRSPSFADGVLTRDGVRKVPFPQRPVYVGHSADVVRCP